MFNGRCIRVPTSGHTCIYDDYGPKISIISVLIGLVLKRTASFIPVNDAGDGILMHRVDFVYGIEQYIYQHNSDTKNATTYKLFTQLFFP